MKKSIQCFNYIGVILWPDFTELLTNTRPQELALPIVWIVKGLYDNDYEKLHENYLHDVDKGVEVERGEYRAPASNRLIYENLIY